MRNRAIQVYEYVMDMDFNDYEENIEQDLAYIEWLLKEYGLCKTIEILRYCLFGEE